MLPRRHPRHPRRLGACAETPGCPKAAPYAGRMLITRSKPPPVTGSTTGSSATEAAAMPDSATTGGRGPEGDGAFAPVPSAASPESAPEGSGAWESPPPSGAASVADPDSRKAGASTARTGAPSSLSKSDSSGSPKRCMHPKHTSISLKLVALHTGQTFIRFSFQSSLEC